MPLFFIHQVHELERIEDLEGAEFADADAAKQEAVLAARELMADRLRAGKNPDHSYFEIADEHGKVVASLSFIEAIPDREED